MTLDNYSTYFAYRNVASKDLCLNVVKKPFIINLSEEKISIGNITTVSCNTKQELDQNLIFQIISDRMYSQYIDIFSGNTYEYYILLIKENNYLDTNNRNKISKYLYDSENIIELFKFRFETENYIDAYLYQKSNNLILYQNDLSYYNLKSILIKFLPEELIQIIYNMLNITKINFNYLKSTKYKNYVYICNPYLEINSNLLYSKIKNDVMLESGSYIPHKFLLKDESL